MSNLKYKDIRTVCQQIQHLASTVIDDFLIHYAIQHDKLNREAEKQLARFRHVSKKLPQEWTNMSITQHIAHRVFRRNGFIKKYINHSGLSHLTLEEMAFLKQQAQNPWRFSFAEITGRPEQDFFEMYDVFTRESYLLYSTGLSDILTIQKVSLCFNLIGYNGKCWQTYGPIGTYAGFESRDILFFAEQLNGGQWIEDGVELMENVEENPVPYMYLFAGANLPQTFHVDDQIVQIASEYLDGSFDADVFRNNFTVEYNRGVYKISQPDWNHFPHYSAAYYDEKKELLFLYSMTDRGFCYLVRQLNECGYQLDYNPGFRVNMAMVSTAGDILKEEIKLNHYESLFESKPPDEEPP